MRIKRQGILYLFLIGIAFYLYGCGAGVTTTSVQTTEKNMNEAVKYEGPKARIAVASFKCKAAKCGGRIGSGIRDMLVDALVRTNKFIVLERGEGLEEIKKELELGQSGLVQEGKAPEVGLMEGADILVVGSIVAFEPNAGGIKGGIGGLIPKVPLLGGIKLGKEEAYIAMTLRFIDVRTGRIINSTRVEGKASSFNVGGLGGGLLGTIPLGGGLEVYRNTPMEKAVMVLIDNAVKAIEKYVPESYYRYKGGKATGQKKKVATTQKASAPLVTTAPSPEEKGNLIFFETFEKYGIGQSAPFGRWEGNDRVSVKQVVQVNGQIGKAANFKNGGDVCISGLNLKNFILELDFIKIVDNVHTNFDIRFRVQKNPFSGYALNYHAEKLALYKMAGDMKVKIAENKGNFRTSNGWSHLRLVVNENNIKAYANRNNVIIDITDNDPSMNREGIICIHANYTPVIDNVKIYRIAPKKLSIEGAWHGRYYGHVGSGEWAWVIWKNPDGSYGGRLNTTGTYPGKNIPIKINLEGNKIEIGWVMASPMPMGGGGIAVTFSGTVKGNTMEGTWMFSNGMDSGKWDGQKGKTDLTPSASY